MLHNLAGMLQNHPIIGREAIKALGWIFWPFRLGSPSTTHLKISRKTKRSETQVLFLHRPHRPKGK